MGKYKLIALDLDGTLLDDEKNIPQANIDAIQKATAAGKLVMIATGRPYRGALKVVEKLGMDSAPILCQAGAVLCRYPGEEILYRGLHEQQFLRDITDYCAERKVFFHCMSGEDYRYTEYYPILKVVSFFMGSKGVQVSREEICKLNVSKVTLIMEPERMANILPEVRRLFGHRVEIAQSDPTVIDITPKGVDKGTSLQQVAKAFGITIEEMIAVGDSENDVAMIAAAGLGVCLANGGKTALAAADYIAPSNNDAGVAHVIERFMLD